MNTIIALILFAMLIAIAIGVFFSQPKLDKSDEMREMRKLWNVWYENGGHGGFPNSRGLGGGGSSIGLTSSGQ